MVVEVVQANGNLHNAQRGNNFSGNNQMRQGNRQRNDNRSDGRQNGGPKKNFNKNGNDQWKSQNQTNQRRGEDGGGDYKNKPAYQRNDRWQARNPHNHQSHTQHNILNPRGIPLPDWEEVAEAAQESEFDYMNLMESQYQQVVQMMTLPPFDPNMAIKNGNGSYMVPFIPQNGAQFFRAPVVTAGPPPQALNATTMPHPGLQAAAQAAIDKRIKTVPQKGQPAQTQATTSTDSRPDSVASSINSTIPPTPTTLLSPNGIVPPHMNFRPLMQTPLIQPYFAPFNGVARPVSLAPDYRGEDIKTVLCKQIEYYFSVENLQKDFFLRRRMDKQGYLPLTVVASFPRVQKLTFDLNFIAMALVDSDKVELDNANLRIRTRINPESWPMDPEIPKQSIDELSEKNEGSPAGSSADNKAEEKPQTKKESNQESAAPKTSLNNQSPDDEVFVAETDSKAQPSTPPTPLEATTVPTTPRVSYSAVAQSSVNKDKLKSVPSTPSTPVQQKQPQTSKSTRSSQKETSSKPKQTRQSRAQSPPQQQPPEASKKEGEDDWQEVKKKIKKPTKSKQGERPRRRKNRGGNEDRHDDRRHVDTVDVDHAPREEKLNPVKREEEKEEKQSSKTSSEVSSNSDSKQASSVWAKKALERAAASASN